MHPKFPMHETQKYSLERLSTCLEWVEPLASAPLVPATFKRAVKRRKREALDVCGHWRKAGKEPRHPPPLTSGLFNHTEAAHTPPQITLAAHSLRRHGGPAHPQNRKEAGYSAAFSSKPKYIGAGAPHLYAHTNLQAAHHAAPKLSMHAETVQQRELGLSPWGHKTPGKDWYFALRPQHAQPRRQSGPTPNQGPAPARLTAATGVPDRPLLGRSSRANGPAGTHQLLSLTFA